jgi:hypothetical protein
MILSIAPNTISEYTGIEQWQCHLAPTKKRKNITKNETKHLSLSFQGKHNPSTENYQHNCSKMGFK